MLKRSRRKTGERGERVRRRRDRPMLHLVLHAARMLESMLREELGADGVHHGQGRALSVLSGSNGAMTQVELSQRLFMGQPGVTAVVTRLEELGYVRRSVSRDDARAILVTLTGAGSAAAEVVHEAWARVDERLERGLTGALGQDGPMLARRVLEALRDSMLVERSPLLEAGDA